MGTPASISWIPSTARVIVLDGFGIVPRGTLQAAQQLLAWPVKDPGDILDYVFDVSEALAGSEGDSIATLDVQIAPALPGGLGDECIERRWEQSHSFGWRRGFAGTTYAVTLMIGTQSGRMIARTVSLPVLALAAQASSGDAITDQTGQPITDQNDIPLTATG